MSTTAVTSSTESIVDAPVATEQYTAVVLSDLVDGKPERDKEGKVVYRVEAGKEAEENARKAASEGKVHIYFTQSATIQRARTEEGMSRLVPSLEERLYLFNKGAIQKQQSKFRAKLIEVDDQGALSFEPSDSSFDLSDILAEESQRRNLTDEEKAIRAMEKLPEDVIARAMAVLQARKAAAAQQKALAG